MFAAKRLSRTRCSCKKTILQVSALDLHYTLRAANQRNHYFEQMNNVMLATDDTLLLGRYRSPAFLATYLTVSGFFSAVGAQLDELVQILSEVCFSRSIIIRNIRLKI